MFSDRQQYLSPETTDYDKALADFGITELLQKLAQITESSSQVEELKNLAALLIKHLTNTLPNDCIDSYFNAVHNGWSKAISQVLSRSQRLPIPADSPSFFLDASLPCFPFGTAVRWTLLDEPELTDWGIVIGRFYGYAPESGRWLWCYLILLDPDSPSARWCVVDTAWELDLERFDDE